ncbi:MAG: DUF1840 domain-containing protein [Propionivibrio sp.]
MLVKLTSNTSGEIIIFAEHLHQLFEIIGKEGTMRGVFTTEQLPPAIEKLHRAVGEEKQVLHEAGRKAHEARVDRGAAADKVDEEAEEDRKAGRIGVHLAQRAHPLIQMMEWTYKEGGFILWEADKDF